jgi:hypothetical protein
VFARATAGWGRAPGILFLLLVAGACTEGGERPGAGVEMSVRDSAGVRVVELPLAALASPPGELAFFSPDPEAGPALRVGVVEGSEAYQFTALSGGARLADGNHVVLERPSRTLRFYDPEGRHLRTVGGNGDGPGEFRNPSLLHVLPGDTLLVLDQQQQRLHWFAPDGVFLHDAAFSGLGAELRVSWAAPATEGGLYLAGAELMMPGPDLRSGRIRGEAEILHWRPGASARSVGRFPGGETEIRATTQSGELVAIEVMNYWFLARLAHARGEHGVWTTDGVTPEIILRGGGGERTRVRFTGPLRPLDRAARDTVEGVALDRAPDEATRERLRTQHAETPYPEHIPPLADLFADAAGRLWVAPTDLRSRNLPQAMGRTLEHWFVRAGDGTPLGWVTLPPESRPLWASDDGVLLVRMDALEIPFLEWWPARGASSG